MLIGIAQDAKKRIAINKFISALWGGSKLFPALLKMWILLGGYNHSLSFDAKIMVARNYPIIGKHVAVNFVTQLVTIATIWPTKNTLNFSFKVSARVKKGEFSKFLISGHLDKVFQELSFKKISQKNYYFSAKLLDVEVYYTLIVLITSWRVLSFWSNMYVSMSRNNITRFSRAIDAARLVQMPSKKRRGHIGFSPATARRKKPKKSLSSDWAENLADSNKGLILRPGAMAEGVERAAKNRMRPVGFHINI